MIERPETKRSPLACGQNVPSPRVLRSCTQATPLNNCLSSPGFGLAFAITFVALSFAPAAARPYLERVTGSPPMEAHGPGSDGGKVQCEANREWSQLNLPRKRPAEGRAQGAGALSYIGLPGDAGAADIAEARAQVERIVRISGLEMNFEMIVDPSTPAAAEIVNGRRVILFDPHFMAQVADRICPDWGAMSILAHEVGHHLAGHTLRRSSEPWEDELEADEFSGFVLARLGATEVEATSAAARILPDQPTTTHPGRADRIAAIVHGWQNAIAMNSHEQGQSRQTGGLIPIRQTPYNADDAELDPSNLSLSARIILYNDPSDYYITHGGRIDAYDGARRPISRKTAPSSAEYAWSFQSEGLRLNVGFNGRISIRLPSGVVYEVGLIVPLMPLAFNGK